MTEDRLDGTPDEQKSYMTSHALIGYSVLVLLIVVGFLLGGQAGNFAQVGIGYVPFVALAALAYLGLRYPAAKLLTLLWLFLIFVGFMVMVVGYGALATLAPTVPPEDALFEPAVATTIGGIGGFAVVSVLLACLGFVPAVRRALSQWLPIDPESFVHAVALVTVTGLTLMSFAPLLILAEPPLLTDAALEMMRETGMDADGLLTTLYTLVWSVPIAIFAVGFGIHRTFAQALQRLGLVRPTLSQVVFALGLAAVLVVGVNLLELVIDFVWRTLGWPRTDVEAFGELMAFAMTPLGAIVVAISAGLGEELAVRGVLQPRLGILLSNLFFAGLHAFQYNWDGILIVFLLGMIFGVLRRYTNTSTTAVAHGAYNFFVIMLAIYGITIIGN